jgi:hypothetical protein
MGRGSGVSISIRLLTQKMELHVQIGNLNDLPLRNRQARMKKKGFIPEQIIGKFRYTGSWGQNPVYRAREPMGEWLHRVL